MVGWIELFMGFAFGLIIAIRAFTVRPDLVYKFQDALKSFEDKKRITKPSPDQEVKP